MLKERVALGTCLIILIGIFTPSHAGFLDNLFGSSDGEKSENLDKNDNSCEDVRVLPRVAYAIVGGSRIHEQTSVPYMVALGERLNNGSIFWFCGGSLISKNAVLTAAHCISSRKADYVRLGDTRLTDEIDSKDIRVASTNIHPDYKRPAYYHDIAVVKLSVDTQFSVKVKPICLAKDNSGRTAGEVTSVTGWGAQSVGGGGTKDLRQVKVRIFSSDECDRVYSEVGKRQFPEGIKEGQICAGSPEGGKDSCQGDSGGPLVVEDKGVVRLLGIVSSGAVCGLKEFPGVYVRISAYQTWINQYL